MIIDAENLIVGRLASIVAKKALLGEKIDIVNADKAVIVGRKEGIFEKYKRQSERGEPFHGPFLPKKPDRLLKRIIRGMLPYKQTRGRDAFKRIKCHIGIPDELKDKKIISLEEADVTKTKNLRYINLAKICEFLG